MDIFDTQAEHQDDAAPLPTDNAGDDNDEISDYDYNGDYARWQDKVVALGLWERYEERRKIQTRLCHVAWEKGIRDEEESIRALSYEEWLSADVLFEYLNYSSYPRLVLREMDKWLWEGEPISFSEDSIDCYLYSWDDVVVLRATEQITTQDEWDALVEGGYRAAWQKYQDLFHGRRQSIAWWSGRNLY